MTMDPSSIDSMSATTSTQHQGSISQPSAQHPSTQSNSGPQIRSRITVVCAECKRLKLKCDRRNPCGSCTKRDTVARCIYSPAAAEKVDLHSLNNRLIQVESTLALITAGQTPPAFVSSYPPSITASQAHAQAQAQGITVLSSTCTSSISTPIHHAMPTHHNGHVHVHHHHAAAQFHSPTNRALLTIPMEDVASLWFADLDVGNSYPTNNSTPPNSSATSFQPNNLFPSTNSSIPSFGARPSNGNGYIKLEPSPAELSHPGLSIQSIVIDGDFDPNLYSHDAPQTLRKNHSQTSNASYSQQSRSPTPDRDSSPAPQVQRRRRRPLAAQATNQAMHLPPLTAYYTNTTPSRADQYEARNHYHQHVSSDASSRPGIAHELFSRFPHISTCRTYLDLAERVLELKACASTYMYFSASAASRDGKGLASAFLERWIGGGLRVNSHEAEERTRTIAFSGDNAESETRINHGNSDPGDAGGCHNDWEADSLPVFMGVCSILAIGALAYLDNICAEETTEEAIILHRQDADFLFALSGQATSVWEDWVRNTDRGSHDLPAEYPYGVLQSDEQQIERDDLAHLTALILQAIFLVLDHPLDVAASTTREENSHSTSEKFRRNAGLLALLGKLVISARALGLAQDPHFGPTDDSWAHSEASDASQKDIERAERKRELWWDVLFLDLFVSDRYSQPPLIMHNSYDTRLPLPRSMHTASVGKSPITSPYEQPSRDETSDDNSELHGFSSSQYLDARYRLVQLTRTIKHRMLYPDCCCGYTLDQAATLEGEIQSWMGAWGALSLSNSESGDAQSSPGPLNNHDLVAQAQRCELALWGWKLILRLWVPFLRPPHSNSTSHTATLGNPPNTSWSAPYPATRSTVSAAQGMIRTVQTLLGTCNVRTLVDTPVMMDFYSLERTILDAVAVCMHAGKFGQAVWGAGVIEDASDGLCLLGKLGITGKTTPLHRVVSALRRRVKDMRGHGPRIVLKRKHNQIEEGRVVLVPATENLADAASNNHLAPTSGPGVETSAYNVSDDTLEQPQPPRGSPRAPVGGMRSSTSSPDQEKRFPKRAPTYPPVGIRLRGKESASPSRHRHSVSKLSSPPSNIARVPDERMIPPPPNPRIVGSLDGMTFQPSLPGHYPQQSHSQPIPLSDQRSRASSINHDQYLHKPSEELTSTSMMDYSLPFPTSETAHLSSHHDNRRRFQEPSSQHLQTQQGEGPFLTTMFEPSESSLENFDGPRPFEAHQHADYDRPQPSRTPSEALFAHPTNTSTSTPYENTTSVSASISTSSSPYVQAHSIPPNYGSHGSSTASNQNASPPTFGSSAPSPFYLTGNHNHGGYSHPDNVIHGATPLNASANVPKAMSTNGGTMVGAAMQTSLYDNKGGPGMDGIPQGYQNPQSQASSFNNMHNHGAESETRGHVHNITPHAQVQIPSWSPPQHLQAEASYWTATNGFKFYQ